MAGVTKTELKGGSQEEEGRRFREGKDYFLNEKEVKLLSSH